jgi:hypothetical protein
VLAHLEEVDQGIQVIAVRGDLDQVDPASLRELP